MTNDKKCSERVEDAFKSRMEDIRTLYKAQDDALNDYGLGIDRVEAGTFEKQRAPYIRYQLSWGGPSEEFRIYDNGEVEFWYLDWYDGACVEVTGEDADIIKDITAGVIQDF